MTNSPENGRENAQQKTTDQTQQKTQVKISNGQEAASFSTDDVDKIATWLAVIFGAVGTTVLIRGHNYVALWLGFATVSCAVTALIGYLNERSLLPWPIAGRPWRSCVALGAVMLVITAWTHWGWAQDELAGISGQLFEGSIPTSANGDPIIERVPLRVFLGGCFTITNGNKITAVRFRDEDLFVVERKNNRLLVSATLRDPSGMIVCEIADNQFQLKQPKYFKISNTHHRFVLEDITGKTIMSLELTDRWTIKAMGEFFAPNGTPIRMDAEKAVVGNVELRDQIGMAGMPDGVMVRVR